MITACEPSLFAHRTYVSCLMYYGSTNEPRNTNKFQLAGRCLYGAIEVFLRVSYHNSACAAHWPTAFNA